MWCGRDGACGPEHVAALNDARERGTASIEEIARTEGGEDTARTALVSRYLRDNLRYGLGELEIAGLRRFHELAADQGIVPGLRDLRFY
jgi:hypothetical protein